jgi:hypothetical protein
MHELVISNFQGDEPLSACGVNRESCFSNDLHKRYLGEIKRFSFLTIPGELIFRD